MAFAGVAGGRRLEASHLTQPAVAFGSRLFQAGVALAQSQEDPGGVALVPLLCCLEEKPRNNERIYCARFCAAGWGCGCICRASSPPHPIGGGPCLSLPWAARALVNGVPMP